MRYVLLIALAVAAFPANAGLFSSLAGMSLEEKKPLKAYTLDTLGINPRVYEFKPVNAPDRLCVLVVGQGDSSRMVLQCFTDREK